MYRIMTADEAISLIRDGDCICVNSFVGIENPVELHEALGRRYEKTHSPSTSPSSPAQASAYGTRTGLPRAISAPARWIA